MNVKEIAARCGSLIETGLALTPDMFTEPSAYVHQVMSDEFIDPDNRLVNLVIPRGHAKSSYFACIGVLWHLFFEEIYRYLQGTGDGKHRKRVIVVISKTEGEAKKRLKTLKDVLNSPAAHAILGDFGQNTAKRWTTTEIELKDGSVIISKGMGQQVRGLKEGHLRPTLVIVDDPEDAKNTVTEASMEANLKFITQEVEPGMDPKGRLFVIGTPINMGCMVVRLHEATSWRSIWFQNDAEENRSRQLIQTDDGAEEKVFEGVLWPERYTAETLLSKKKMLEQFGQLSGYYREWEAKAVGAEDQSFRPDMFRYWFGKLMFDAAGKPYLRVTHRSGEDSQVAKELDPPELIPVETYVGIDPASSVSETADFTVICPIAVDSERNIYVLPYVRGRYQTFDLIDKIRNVHRGVRPRRGLIETTSAQVHLAAFLREDGIRYVEDKPFQRKVGEDSRIGGIQYLFATGKVFIQREMTQLYLELVQYPRARKDDTSDALEKAIRVAGRGRPYHGISDEKDVEKREKKRKVLDWILS